MEDKIKLVSNFIDENMREIPASLNDNLNGENGRFSKRIEFEEIKDEINKYLNGKKNDRFIVLPGIRGVGKTTLLYQIYEYLIKEKNIPVDHVL